MASSKKPRHVDLAARVETFLKQTVQPGQRLLLGFSGGLDSTVLLHLLHGLRAACGYELFALHVNHGISPNAGAWQQHCADACAALQVRFSAVQVDVPRDSGLGIEAAARIARYAALKAFPTDRVVLAHHRDDQAETLLLQLLRGAGLKGLSAMPTDSSQILRPLLDTPRAMLEQYAQTHGLRWIEDESNLELAYDRNFIRHSIMPSLEQRFPASRLTLARSASHLAEAADLLDEVAQEDVGPLLRDGRLDIFGMRTLSLPRAKNVLRYWLAGYLPEAPNTSRLQEIYKQLTGARDEARIEMMLEGGCIRRYRGEAWFDRASLAAPDHLLVWQGERELLLPGGQLSFNTVQGDGLSCAKLKGLSLTIQVRKGGESLRLYPNRPARSLKNLFQEAGVPAWQRLNLPLVYCGDALVAVPGIGVAQDWKAGAGEDGLEIIWQRV